LIKQIAFDQSGRFIVVNSSDRAVRVLAITPSIISEEEPGDLFADEIIPLHRFQDTIGKTPWNTVGFSGDGEYVMGGAGIKTSHHIYVWDRSTGVLIKVLEGPKDALDDCDVSSLCHKRGAQTKERER
jgi:COMPASS component SWD1